MKTTKYILLTLTTATLTLLISCNSSRERVHIPGTHCTIEIPEGYELTAENIIKGPDSSIWIYETTANLETWAELAARNADQLIEAEVGSSSTFQYGGKTFARYGVQQSDQEYVVLILQNKSYHTFVNALYTPGNDDERKAILNAMLSVKPNN